MGLFDWIRQGVRRAVVLGFSDAVADIGDRTDGDDLGEQLADTLRQRLAVEPASKHTSPPFPAAPGRKRLGKSLEQIRNENA
jgi:hypothetical protein